MAPKNPEHENACIRIRRGKKCTPEVTWSKKSDGEVKEIKKRVQLIKGSGRKAVPSPVPTSWLFYNFAVNSPDLKTKKHKDWAKKVANYILDTFAFVDPKKRWAIRIWGYASKSGTIDVNQKIAKGRASNLKKELIKNGIPRNWILEAEVGDGLHALPKMPKVYHRAASRSAQLILPNSYLSAPLDEFNKNVRARVRRRLQAYCINLGTTPTPGANARGKVCAKSFTPFAKWLLANWDFFQKKSNKYLWSAKGVDIWKDLPKGLFFAMPSRITSWKQLTSAGEGFSYLDELYRNYFCEMKNHYFNKYAASQGAIQSATIAYQQSLRWWALERYTSSTDELKKIMNINGVKANVKKLHGLIKANKYGTPALTFKKINDELLKFGIPCRVNASTSDPTWI